MEPHQAIAARHVALGRQPARHEIDAFYDDNALETLHACRHRLGRLALVLRAAIGRARGGAPEIAPKAGRA